MRSHFVMRTVFSRWCPEMCEEDFKKTETGGGEVFLKAAECLSFHCSDAKLHARKHPVVWWTYMWQTWYKNRLCYGLSTGKKNVNVVTEKCGCWKIFAFLVPSMTKNSGKGARKDRNIEIFHKYEMKNDASFRRLSRWFKSWTTTLKT